MKKLLFALVLILIAFAFWKITPLLTAKKLQVSPKKTTVQTAGKQNVLGIDINANNSQISSLFIPYWTLSKKIDSNDQLIYFGVLATKDGINQDDPGYKTIPNFISLSPSSSVKYLTVRMLSSSDNLSILSSPSAQANIISQSINIAKTNNFNGVILDFEISAISFNSLVKQINTFISNFSKQTKNSNLSFGITMYGDTFFRARPFDIKTLGANVDQIYVLTYDFSKSEGANPGPNFPYRDKSIYGYDFPSMIADFTSAVAKNKLSIIYGMFGYDWSVDKNNQSTTQAQALTLEQINSKFLNNCKLKNCKIQTDPISKETKVTYTDTQGNNHIVWFEDNASAAVKDHYAKENGIQNNGYWAYSYY